MNKLLLESKYNLLLQEISVHNNDINTQDIVNIVYTYVFNKPCQSCEPFPKVFLFTKIVLDLITVN